MGCLTGPGAGPHMQPFPAGSARTRAARVRREESNDNDPTPDAEGDGVWLIDKTAMSFVQIADFCGMHPLEVQAIADGEVAAGIVGYDPVANGQLSPEEIKRCEADPAARPKLMASTIQLPKRSRAARYTPVAKRNDRPDGIAYLLRNFPQLTEAQVGKLMGTTKETIQKVRDRSHWNSANIKPRRPGDPGPVHADRPERHGHRGQRAADA